MTASPTCAIVGAAESTDIGTVPHFSSTGLALDAAGKRPRGCRAHRR